MQQCNKTVRPSSLLIYKEFGFLAASPDGKYFNYLVLEKLCYFGSIIQIYELFVCFCYVI